MKKILCVLIICMSAVAAFAEGKQICNAPFIDLGPTLKKLRVGQFGVNAGYEFTIGRYFGAEATVGYGYYWDDILFSDGVHEFIPGVGFRFYLSGNAPSGAWVGLNGQYYLNLIKNTWGGFAAASLRVGYKLLFDESAGGLFIEPYIGYSASFLEQILFAADFGFRVGWAF